jgi:hypothetical protein
MVVRVRAVFVMAHVLSVLALWGSAVLPASAQPAAPPTQQKEPVQPTVTPIPVPEIAQRAEHVPPALRIVEQIATGSDVQDIEAQLPAAAEWIRGRLMGTTQAPPEQPACLTLETDGGSSS